MSKCLSPTFLSLKQKNQKKNGGFQMKKEYFLVVNGEKVYVSKEVYSAYWKDKNHKNIVSPIYCTS